MFANICIRQIENGYIVGNGGPNMALVGAYDDIQPERYFASEDELRAAAAGILIGALDAAKSAREKAIAQQLMAQQNVSRYGQAGDITRGYGVIGGNAAQRLG